MTPTEPAPADTANIGITNNPAPRRGRPRSSDAKSVRQIALRPADWQYLALYGQESYNTPDNDSTRMERLVDRARKSAPEGPDAPFWRPDPDAPKKPRTTPAIAREAKRRGIDKAVLLNEMWDAYKAKEASK